MTMQNKTKLLPDEIFIVDFISDVIDDMKDTKSISSITDNEDGTYTVNTADTGRLKDYYYVTIGSNSYEITSVVEDTSFIVTPVDGSTPTGNSWTTKINYFYGTPIAINTNLAKISGINNYVDKEPIIALFEPFDENINLEELENEYIDTSLWMALVKPYSSDWLTPEHYTRAIKPMTYLFRDMLTVLKKKEGSDVVKIIGYKKTNHAKYGLWSKNKGHTVQLLEKVSGIDITDLNLQLSKQYTCE